MKRLILAFCLVLLSFAVAFGNPFLVCDPQTDVDEYVVTIDGVTTTEPYQEVVFSDGTYAVIKDLDGIPDGTHNVSVKAKNMWGESVSVPFVFSSVKPSSPSGIGLHP
jgi:hypothetical protein